jgi:hypothetical protein
VQSEVYITRRRHSEWKSEYALAQRVRPAAQGGMGWLRPLHPGLFRGSLTRTLSNWLSLRSLERLVIHGDDPTQIGASMWIESAFASSTIQLSLMVAPEYQGFYDEPLVNLAVRRYSERSPITIDHPADDMTTAALLQRYHFRPQRTLVHMRWDALRRP